MEKTKFFMMIGLPGSGKSFYAKELAERENAVIISSDAIRGELWGDESDQREPEKVFSLVHERIRENINNGKNVIYDATNLVKRYREGFLKDAGDAEKIAVIIATEPDVVKQQNSSRTRVVPEEVIDNMLKKFNWPRTAEGFGKIEIVRSERNTTTLEEYLDKNNIDHDCPEFHIGTVKEHMIGVQELADENLWYSDVLRYHDIGKYLTKSFMYKGKVSDRANYFGHADVSGYLAACAGMSYIKCLLIASHMDQFFKNWDPTSIPSEIRTDIRYRTAFFDIHNYDILESKNSLEQK